MTIDLLQYQVWCRQLFATEFKLPSHLIGNAEPSPERVASGLLPNEENDRELWDTNQKPMFMRCIEEHGALQRDECFGFAPALGLVGFDSQYRSVEHVKRYPVLEHFAMIAQMQPVRRTRMGQGAMSIDERPARRCGLNDRPEGFYMPEMLTYENDPMAVPAFRILAIIDGDLADKRSQSRYAAIYGQFEAAYGEAANVTSYHFDKHEGVIKWMKPDLLEEGCRFFERPKAKYSDGLRRYGLLPAAFDNPALPYFGIENQKSATALEIALPIDAATDKAFADKVLSELDATPLICGVMGFGFFLPPYKSSLAFMLGQASQRYRAAFEIRAGMVIEGIRREGSFHRWKADEMPGIADVGWRTLVGNEFLPRLPPRLEAMADVASVEVRRGPNFVTVTAGAEPIWGDINAQEDLTAYQAVAAFLKPIRFPVSCGHNFMFGGDHPGCVDAYLARFDDV